MAAIADSTSFKAPGLGRSLGRRLRLTGFGHWWAHELVAMTPPRLRSALLHRRARPVLAFEGNRATLWRPAQANGRVQMTEVAQIALEGDPQAVTAGGRAALAPIVRAANGAVPEVIVAVPARATLRKTLTLPAAIEPSLYQALAYDLDRHTPFKADELYYDAVIADRDTARNTLHVDLAAARRALVDPMLRHAESFGARVVGVAVDPPPAAAASRFNLLPEERRVAGARWTRWQFIVPALTLLAGILAALVLPVWQKRTEAIELIHGTEEARARASVSDGLRTELERRVGDYNFALERKYAFPGAVQVLDDVTRILPDDTWLTQLELRSARGRDGQRELTLRGESANAGRLVSLLEESKLFTQAAPRSPTTKIQPGPGEIFDLGAQLKPLAAPAAAPLDLTARPQPVVQAAPPKAPPAPAATTSAPAAASPGGAPATAANAATPPATTANPPTAAATTPPATATPPVNVPPRAGRAPAAQRSNPSLAPAASPAGTSAEAPAQAGAPPATLQPPPAEAEAEPAGTATEGDGNQQ